MKKEKDNMVIHRIKPLAWTIDDTGATAEGPFHIYVATPVENGQCVLSIQNKETGVLELEKKMLPSEAYSFAQDHHQKAIAEYLQNEQENSTDA